MTYPDGRKFVGEWKDGEPIGQGTYIYGKGKWEGDMYEGEFKDGKKHGQGTYTAPDGRNFSGKFKNGGFWNGILYNKNGNAIERYVNGKDIKP